MSEDSPTRLLISTPKPQASTMLGKMEAFEGIRNATSTGRFTAWSGDNFYAASGTYSYLTGHSGVKIVAGASVSPDKNTSASEDDSAVSGNTSSAVATIGFQALDYICYYNAAKAVLNPPLKFAWDPIVKGLTKSGDTWTEGILKGAGKLVPLGILSFLLGPAGGLSMVLSGPFSIGQSADLETHSWRHAKHRAQGNIESKALGTFSAVGLIGASLYSPISASVKSDLGAVLEGTTSTAVHTIYGNSTVSSRWGNVEIAPYTGKSIIRGEEVYLGVPEEEVPFPPAEMAKLNLVGVGLATYFNTVLRKQPTHVVHLNSTLINAKARAIDLDTSQEDDEGGTIRMKGGAVFTRADNLVTSTVGSANLYLADDTANLMVARAPIPTQVLLETQAPTLETLRDSAIEVTESMLKAKVKELAQNSTLFSDTGTISDLRTALKEARTAYEESLAALEQAFADAKSDPDSLLTSGLRVTPEKVVIHAGPTQVAVDVESGEVRIEQTAGPSPVVAASIVLSGGAITLQAQTTVSIEAGGQSFSFGPTGYSGPNLTELP